LLLGAWAPPLGAVVLCLLVELGAWAPPPAFPTVLAGALEVGEPEPPELLEGELDPVAPVAPVVPVVPVSDTGGASAPPGTVSAGAGGSV
jgi:hypothetical protein